MATQKKMKHNLTRGGCLILKRLLTQGSGWYAKKGDSITLLSGAISLTQGELASIPAEPKPEKNETQEQYDARTREVLEDVIPLELTENERAAAKACLKEAVAAGSLPVSPYTMNLIDEFNLT